MKKVKTVLMNLDAIISGISLVIVVCITMAGVIMRKVVGQPFAWLEEMQLFFLIWMIFFGGSIAFRTGGQVSIDLIANRLEPKARRVLDIFDYIITAQILIYLCKGGLDLMMSVSGKVTPYFKINYVFVDVAAPIGIVLMLIQYTAIMIKEIRREPEGEEKGDEKE